MEFAGLTFADVYKKAAIELMLNPEFSTAPRGLKINEMIGAKLVVNAPGFNLFENEVRSIPLKYLADELILYFSGTNDAKKFEEASPFWGKIKNSDGTVNSAYGNLIFEKKTLDCSNMSQWRWAVETLKMDKDSRQAILHYNRPWHQHFGVKDFPCTISNQFFIRDNNLDLITYMRSNDIFFGLTFDLPFFTLLMKIMMLQLQSTYPDLSLGRYIHFAGSLHAYEKDFDMLTGMIHSKFIPGAIPTPSENPIQHPEIMKMMSYTNYDYFGKNEFFKWLDDCRKMES